ncbi:hypothetical protein WHZ77_17395 [Bradyrhizobium sp. A5]|uniref:hypothetical protein n=1 Tax=Bradyrhizobium sp. A5 TaxID=3133696 RepID=UPI00324F3E37
MENIKELPADSARAILTGLDIQQRERARALSDLARLRKEASAEITRLIAFLDASDPYVMNELEEQVDDGPVDDNELEQNIGPDDLELDNSDLEPSLGSCDGWGGDPANQEHWARGSRLDLEDEHDGREPDESGVGDLDGLLEQVGTQDWQQGAMA